MKRKEWNSWALPEKVPAVRKVVTLTLSTQASRLWMEYSRRRKIKIHATVYNQSGEIGISPLGYK